jgi:DNA-binding response OmpR family regulator
MFVGAGGLECQASAMARRLALVVEDERLIRELLRLHLELAGFTLDEVGDGRTGLESR